MDDACGIAKLGDVMQLAFVPRDFDAAVRHWTGTMGVGPFFLFEDIRLEGMRYRGDPSEAAFDLALAYWGEMQIELIRPRDDPPFDLYRPVRRCRRRASPRMRPGRRHRASLPDL